jgi:dTDP-4-dehydrorhamnose 3,5-epimerase
MLWIPPGFAHGFYVESPTADLLYKCTDYYFPGDDRSIAWDDPDLAIQWPMPQQESPVLSTKDEVASKFSEAELYP